MNVPWLSRLFLLRPAVVAGNLERVRRSGRVAHTPNLWQLTLGVLRMWHRIVFRSDSIGTCQELPVRNTWRARVLAWRPLRFPFLLLERAVAPWDLTGLLSSPERVQRHLLGAHHDGNQFGYDLEILACYPGEIQRLLERVRAVVHRDTPRGRWLRDLTVYEGYHESLLAAVERAAAGDFGLPECEQSDPDISFTAYLSWCAAQPATPAQTLSAWRRSELNLSSHKAGAA